VTQFLGTHGCALLYQGTSQVADTTTVTGSLGTNTGSAAQWVDQPFTTAASQTTITRIELWLNEQGTGADTTVEIRTDNAGAPSNTTLFSVTLPLEFLAIAGGAVSIPVNLTGLTAVYQVSHRHRWHCKHIELRAARSQRHICQRR
jgi:hypothetical protein